MKPEATGRILEAVLMPHAPVLIAGVGGGRECEAATTVASMRRLAEEVVATRPDMIVVVSPHAPRRPGQFGICSGEFLTGDMIRFGHEEVALTLPNDVVFAHELAALLTARGLLSWAIPSGPMDHGAFVPLHFLNAAGWAGPTVIMGLNLPGEGGWRLAGRAIAGAALQCGRSVVVIASGDMSHCLQPGAPAGYHPAARDFDAEFVRLVAAGDYASLAQMDPTLQENAAEDVVDSTLIAAQAVGLENIGNEVLSYEGPFGVGYCVARLFRGAGVRSAEACDATTAGGACLPGVARDAVAKELRGGPSNGHWSLNEYLRQPAGVFVTIRQRDGELRGCRGTIIGRADNLVEETRRVALLSAFGDERFAPVKSGDLDDLVFEVSVLHPAEPVSSPADLDPCRFGLIITTPDGRRGLMLPEVEGLDTVAAQIAATQRKAGISPSEAMSFARFTVDKFAEKIA